MTRIYDAQQPPPDIHAPATRAAWDMSFAAIGFHWGLHGWAGYAVVGLALAFFTYNRGLPLALRSAFYPVLGERVWGYPGHIIDTLAIFATLFGLAPSLGLGAQQVAAGSITCSISPRPMPPRWRSSCDYGYRYGIGAEWTECRY